MQRSRRSRSSVRQVSSEQETAQSKPSSYVDIFDFVKYHEEYEILSRFYSDLELYLKTAIFLDYKYNYLREKDRSVLDIRISEKSGKVLLVPAGSQRGKVLKQKYFDTFTNVFEPHHLLKAWYKHFAPEKLENKNWLAATEEKYAGHEDVAFSKMYIIYVDPEYQPRSIWFTSETRITPRGEVQSMVDFYKTL